MSDFKAGERVQVLMTVDPDIWKDGTIKNRQNHPDWSGPMLLVVLDTGLELLDVPEHIRRAKNDH